MDISVYLVTAGPDIGLLMGNRGSSIGKHREFSMAVLSAFSDVIQSSAPRDTGFMANSVSQISVINGQDGSFGFGAGAYSVIGNPSTKSKRGTIKSFVKANPKLRGKRPLSLTGAWWTLSKLGKEKLRQDRLSSGLYGGRKPAYWYAIAAGLVPDKEGGTLPANIFVDFAIDFANSERVSLAKLYFG